MEVGFSFCNNTFEILNFTHSIEDETNGNPYNCSFDIKIKSGLFSGYANGCEYDYKEWKKFITELEDLYHFKNDEVKMSEICYGSIIIFKGYNLGHIEVSGEIYGDAMEQSLKFVFNADQTVLPEFINQLKSL